MAKKKVLVFDSKGIFLKMFKRRFKDQFEFIEDSFLHETVKESDRIVYVIYNHNELLQFLSQGKKEANTLVCLFNVQFYRSLSFLEVTDNVMLFDESKTRTEILKELKKFFNSKLDFKTDKKKFMPSKISQRKFQEYYRAMYFLM
ncbi:hypothetical protein [Flavobacterium anhuiense]|uniref:hypothetical protein n=1 Tax=Flavobacterium anhuiense TaxID=459526 RepID=UPI003D96F117